tara:strand:- start:141 stop:455 length:315 start_codon:yes stop_codon:yes gene_type:complete
MKKQTLIKKIKTIIDNYGAFSIGEVDGAEGICVNEMGNLVALAEGFNSKTIEVSVYDGDSFSSDSINDYELAYEDLSKEILEAIYFVADLYETEQEKTMKRISN